MRLVLLQNWQEKSSAFIGPPLGPTDSTTRAHTGDYFTFPSLVRLWYRSFGLCYYSGCLEQWIGHTCSIYPIISICITWVSYHTIWTTLCNLELQIQFSSIVDWNWNVSFVLETLDLPLETYLAMYKFIRKNQVTLATRCGEAGR